MVEVSKDMKNLLMFFPVVLCLCSPATRFARYGARDTGGGKNYVVSNERMVTDCLSQYNGTPYKWGGIGNDGIDCSGLVFAVYKDCMGVELPRKAEEQVKYGVKVREREIQTGDLLFFKIDSRKVNHVAVSVGNGKFVHASRNGGVRTDSLSDGYYSKNFIVAKRLFTE